MFQECGQTRRGKSFYSLTDGCAVKDRDACHARTQKGRTCSMAETLFSAFYTVRYEGPKSENPLAYRWYDANRVVLGKPLKDHLRFAVAYWHSLAMQGGDPFGSATMPRPWFAAELG